MKKLLFFIAFLAITLTGCTPNYLTNLKNMKVTNPQTQAEKDKNAILDYLVANKIEAQSTQSGIFYTMTKVGKGDTQPNPQSKVTAHYRGTLLDGKQFDSSYDRNEPLQFGLNQVIKGWQEAIPMLKKGGKGTFFIPSELAYGTRGAGNVIPPNAVLIFDIELVDF